MVKKLKFFENESILCLFLFQLCSFHAENEAAGVKNVHCRDRLQKKKSEDFTVLKNWV